MSPFLTVGMHFLVDNKARISFLSSAGMASQFRDAVVRTVVANATDFSISKDGSDEGFVQINFIHSWIVSSSQRLPHEMIICMGGRRVQC